MPVTIERKIDLTILSIEKEDDPEKIEDIIRESRADIVNILNPKEHLRQFFRDFYYRPLKISYVMKTWPAVDDYLVSLKRNRRKRILKSLRECEQQRLSIVKEAPLKKGSFRQFLKLYKKKIQQKPHGLLLLTPDWLASRKETAAGIFAKIDTALAGGILLNRKENHISICYSASDADYYKYGINDYLNVNAISFAKELGFDKIMRGQDTNLYGHHLSPGLFLFKKSLGFAVEPRPGYALTKILNFDKFGDVIFFISVKNNKLEGNLFFKKINAKSDEFKADFLERLNVIYLRA
jgi:hypothetical protein